MEGEGDAPHPIFDESVIDGSDHAGGSHVDTASAARSSGGSYASELSSKLLNSLQHADDPLMQQLGSFLSASVAETADLRRRLGASKEKARINQMVRDYEGLSITIVGRWRMYLLRSFSLTSLIAQLVSTTRTSTRTRPSLRSLAVPFPS